VPHRYPGLGFAAPAEAARGRWGVSQQTNQQPRSENPQTMGQTLLCCNSSKEPPIPARGREEQAYNLTSRASPSPPPSKVGLNPQLHVFQFSRGTFSPPHVQGKEYQWQQVMQCHQALLPSSGNKEIKLAFSQPGQGPRAKCSPQNKITSLLDRSVLNRHLRKYTFRMLIDKGLRRSILSDAYFHIAIYLAHRKFAYQGKAYEYQANAIWALIIPEGV